MSEVNFIALRVSETLDAVLRTMAAKERRPVSQLVRVLLMEAIERRGAVSEDVLAMIKGSVALPGGYRHLLPPVDLPPGVCA